MASLVGDICLTLYSFVFTLNFKLNTKRYVPKAFLSPFVDGMVMAQTLARWYAIPPHSLPPHFKPCFPCLIIMLLPSVHGPRKWGAGGACPSNTSVRAIHVIGPSWKMLNQPTVSPLTLAVTENYYIRQVNVVNGGYTVMLAVVLSFCRSVLPCALSI